MNINYKNIGTDFESFELYLDVEDYLALFEKEIAYGKLLKVFAGLGEMISANPAKLKEWVLHDSRYKDVLEVSRKICTDLGWSVL